MTLTSGAHKATTTKGLIMRGAELVTITDPAAISIADNLSLILPTFRLNTLFSSASAADMGIMNLNNGAVIARLNSTTGALDIIFNDADGGADETVSTTKVSWAADTEWQVGFTFVKAADGTVSVKLYLNGVAENTNDHCDTDITIPAGNTTYGYDGTTYLTGRITRGPKIWSTVALSAAQMLLANKGIILETNLALNHMIDEGRGLTIDDKITGSACDGTISGTNTVNIWDYGVKQAMCGFDGVDNYASSASSLNILGDVTLVEVIKAGSTYDTLAKVAVLLNMAIDGNNRLDFLYDDTEEAIIFRTRRGSTTDRLCAYSTKPAIGDYLILIGTLTVAGVQNFYVNGTLAATVSHASAITGAAAAYLYLGRPQAADDYYDPSCPMLPALLDGALSGKEALDFSRTLNAWLNLGLTI